MSGVVTSLASRLARVVPSEDRLSGYLLRLSRPRFWFYLAGPVVVGVTYAASGTADLFTPATLALFAYFLLPANVFLYGVNDAFDRDIDEHNPKKAEKEVRFRRDAVVGVVVTFAGALGALFLFVLPTVGVQVLLLYFLLAVEYSAPPLRFKTTPFLDSLSNGLYALPGVIAFVAVAGVLPPTAAIAGAWLWTMAMHTFSAIPDIEPDREAGISTTATFLGERTTYAYCGLVWLAAAAAFALLDYRLGLLLGVYPLFVTGVALSDVAVDRAYWWFPFLNTVVGAVMTMGKLWVMVNG
ncbi:prenyltransferase [Haloarchaeobius iranensis]|uniref:4-hydroxybenzoate polyprenyltransferase n=1 Tax=Haloarchaeobius iranensis TaxID=996166 RepID=A0A1G9X2I7_9EURY|nr:prenyltransferase [Haloarchaeobius iranensis]SDM90892.1 4-hydroxybenzoate polyprenyltransferase [Haloarchaeobius iranensis]